jgi:16S rRNA (guanine(966)-N(2))-methyltransferase RsmD
VKLSPTDGRQRQRTLLRSELQGRFARIVIASYTGGMRKSDRSRSAESGHVSDEPVVGLRIIGGSMGGRKLAYSGDLRTRPMKDRVREAVFNLLGRQIAGSHAIDLFAGTGALGLEALSRGATKATFIERHFPTSKLIEQNAAALQVTERTEVVFGDAFVWSAAFQPAEGRPLTVFCCPPYDFYAERLPTMLELIAKWVELSPAGSQIVVEADERFDFSTIIQSDKWDVRAYLPAVVGIFEKT